MPLLRRNSERTNLSGARATRTAIAAGWKRTSPRSPLCPPVDLLAVEQPR